MIFPYGRKGLIDGLEREILRRQRSGEPSIEYFAPLYVEAREVNDRIVDTEKHLLYNYVFVHASENELFRMKRFEEQYNFPRRETTNKGEYYYPYVSDAVMRDLRWIARSYSGVIPVYTGDSSWLVKGDRIRITKGRFKGVEASLYENPRHGGKEILVVVECWLNIPLLRVREGEYRFTGIGGGAPSSGHEAPVDESLLSGLHEALCRFHRGGTTEEDRRLARNAISRHTGVEPVSDVMRSKLYALLLPAYTILGEHEKRSSLAEFVQVMLRTLKAEQSKALLLVTLYGCTDSSIHHEAAHRAVSPWRSEANPKKSKRLLIQRLADYDTCFKH